MSITIAVIVITSINTMGRAANAHCRPVRFSQTVTAKSASPASSWLVAPKKIEPATIQMSAGSQPKKSPAKMGPTMGDRKKDSS